ncbi:hypothetical protein EMCG_00783 [[Emmonsia] crescens]|uniref:Fungal N-terminal domain-containing protein n=1 Tax=[Emmonsia] crescens TaxID=73230 RepID=A0A0G2HPS9_9EURO|nr:hypothetical protein EMCG_00783 [Emmonsia crescens UAMH 3008]
MSEIGTAFFSDLNSPKLTGINVATIHPVLHVARVGFRLSLLLNTVSCDVAAAGIDVHSIAKGLSLYVAALKQVGQSLQTMDSPHSPESSRTAQEISEQSRIIFDDFKIMLDKARRNDGGSIQERFKRCFRKQHVTYLLAHLEALKLSLMVMLHILQLGKLASTRRNILNSQGNDIIQQERDEAQNMIIVRYWAIYRLDRLHDLAVREAMGYTQNESDHRLSNPQLNGTCTQLPSNIPTRFPVISLGNLDSSLAAITQSPKDMIGESLKVIDPLISRWTRVEGYWELPAEQASPQRHVSFESDIENDEYRNGSEGRDSQGYYLEGTTSNWRQPHSQEARKRAAQLRKDYSSLQTRVDSDTDESSNDEGQHRRRNVSFAPHDNTSASEEGTHHREDNGHINNTDKGKPKTSPSKLRIPTPEINVQNHQNSDGRPHSSSSSPRTLPRAIPERQPQRYSHNPSLSPLSHPRSFTSAPGQQQYSANTYVSSSPSSHHAPQPSSYPPPINTNNHSPRKPSPYTAHPHHHQRHRHHDSPSRRSNNSYSSGQQRRDSPAKDDSTERRKNFKRSATTGILGASAITTFISALEDLSI